MFYHYMPLVLAWVLSCLVFSAGFQSKCIAEDVGFTTQSPLAQFNHSGINYSLRFNGLRLIATAQTLDSTDDVDALPSYMFINVPSRIVEVPFAGIPHNKGKQSYNYPRPRGPPHFLDFHNA